MWFNKKSSNFLDTVGKLSRYLSKLISGNTDRGHRGNRGSSRLANMYYFGQFGAPQVHAEPRV